MTHLTEADILQDATGRAIPVQNHPLEELGCKVLADLMVTFADEDNKTDLCLATRLMIWILNIRDAEKPMASAEVVNAVVTSILTHTVVEDLPTLAQGRLSIAQA